MCELPFNSENHYHFSISTTRLKLLCVIQCLVLKGNKVLIVIGGDDNYRDEDRKNMLLSHAGLEGKWRHSLMRNISMEEKASFSPGIKVTEKSTRKH